MGFLPVPLSCECLYFCALSSSQREPTSPASFCHFLSYIWYSVPFNSCLPLTNLASITDISHATHTTGKWDFDWHSVLTHFPFFLINIVKLVWTQHVNAPCLFTQIFCKQKWAHCASVRSPEEQSSNNTTLLGSRFAPVETKTLKTLKVAQLLLI